MRRLSICGIDAEVAETFAQRARGLIGRRELPHGKGMLILRCNAIHTCFMRFAIDAIFLDRHDRVVKTVRNLRPWRLFVWGGWRAAKVLETAASQPLFGPFGPWGRGRSPVSAEAKPSSRSELLKQCAPNRR